MARIEKRCDRRGKLEWACGAARDIFEVIGHPLDARFRIPGQASRWFRFLFPRHMATWEIEGPPTPESLQEMYSQMSPFEQWSFVLIAWEGHALNCTCLAKEISGDQLIEVAIHRNRDA